jgi:hypothetical protein
MPNKKTVLPPKCQSPCIKGRENFCRTQYGDIRRKVEVQGKKEFIRPPFFPELEGNHLTPGMNSGVGPSSGGRVYMLSLQCEKGVLYFLLNSRSHDLPLPS